MKIVKNKRICRVFLFLSVFFVLNVYFQFNLFIYLNSLTSSETSYEVFTIVWWTPFITGERHIHCGHVSCYVTDRRQLAKEQNSAYLFYGTHFNRSDLPLPRNNVVWGLLHEESPRNSPLLNHESVLGLFNYSSTFSRHSDFPLTVQYVPSLESITSLQFFKTFEEKTNYNVSPVMYLQSDCVTPNNRDSYVNELMKYIKIDSYGRCLHNKDLPESLQDSLKDMMSPDLLELISHYKFAIAFENAVCEDYITEKLWRPLIVGTVPLYIGSPSVKDWTPNNDSMISPLDFQSPKHLADYLHYLSNNAQEYNKYLKHKLARKINNEILIKSYNNFNKQLIRDTFIEGFECMICQKLHNNESSIVTKEHYNCPKPQSILSKMYNESNWWHDDFTISKCEANLLRTYIDKGLPLDQMNFKC